MNVKWKVNNTEPDTTDCTVTYKGHTETIRFLHPPFWHPSDACDCFAYIVNAACQYETAPGFEQYTEAYFNECYSEKHKDLAPGYMVFEYELAKQCYDKLHALFDSNELDIVYWVAPNI